MNIYEYLELGKAFDTYIAPLYSRYLGPKGSIFIPYHLSDQRDDLLPRE